MASQRPRKSSAAARPSAPRASSHSQETPRDDKDKNDQAPSSRAAPKRAQTFQTVDSRSKADDDHAPDAFDTGEHSEEDEGHETTRASIELDILPIELVTVADGFIDSLNAKVYPTPPTIEKLSQRFQDFYAQASAHINTHVNALVSRHSRDASPAASSSSITSAASRLRSKASSLSVASPAKEKSKAEAEQQMITTDELADRKKARRALEAKRVLMEEAVERRLCEGIYDRIYRHKSTQDEAQDDKLRSKTAALSLVGIGPADLGVDLDNGEEPSSEAAEAETNDIRTRLEPAKRDLVRMHTSKYPLGKLNHLKAAHRSIVDTIAHFHPSASADEIMPMLIFTLITLPPEDLNVISDIHFIQYFRWAPKLTGEAAYCLTNLEAAVSFLETVDLATLRSDELPSGPPKNQPGTPKSETFPPAYPQGMTAAATPDTAATSMDTATAMKPAASPAGLSAANVLRNRRLSDLVNTPAQALGAASDAMLNTADQIKTISNSLGDSYKYFLGRIRERQEGPREPIYVPRTLEDARKLVSTPSPEEDGAVGLSAEEIDGLRASTTTDDRLLTLLGGKRDRSADSNRSASSSNRGLFGRDDAKTPGPAASATPNQPMLDQVRSFSNNFNPMARLSSMNVMRGFGRTATATPPAEAGKPADGGDLGTAFPDIAAALPPKPKVAPPIKRYMELQNPGDLKLSEVLDLLRDYRRLAGALKTLDAFEEK